MPKPDLFWTYVAIITGRITKRKVLMYVLPEVIHVLVNNNVCINKLNMFHSVN